MRRGAAYAATAYALWGLFPLYFHAVAAVPALEITAHRVVWSLVFMAVLMLALRRTAWLRPTLADRRLLRVFLLSALLLAGNWAIYVWAVVNGHVVEASLGYFINPLFNVLLGRLALGEQLRRPQALAVAIAAAGVAWITWASGQLPWIALALSATFGTYGLMRKTAPLGALESLTLESLLLAPPALLGLLLLGAGGEGHFLAGGWHQTLLLLAAGPLTAVPLLFFGAGAQRIPMSLLGMLQYIGPTIQLTIGVFLFGEAFAGPRVQGFLLIWVACAIFSAELWWRSRTPQPAAAG